MTDREEEKVEDVYVQSRTRHDPEEEGTIPEAMGRKRRSAQVKVCPEGEVANMEGTRFVCGVSQTARQDDSAEKDLSGATKKHLGRWWLEKLNKRGKKRQSVGLFHIGAPSQQGRTAVRLREPWLDPIPSAVSSAEKIRLPLSLLMFTLANTELSRRSGRR